MGNFGLLEPFGMNRVSVRVCVRWPLLVCPSQLAGNGNLSVRLQLEAEV
jgi:hypothetical protein